MSANETAKKVRTVDREGVRYVVEPVQHEGKEVGLAPTVDFENLQEMLDVFDEPTVFALAVRQMKQDAKNKVRAKFSKDTASTKAIFAAVMARTITTAQIEKIQTERGVSAQKAGSIALGIGTGEVDPEQIHWDVL